MDTKNLTVKEIRRLLKKPGITVNTRVRLTCDDYIYVYIQKTEFIRSINEWGEETKTQCILYDNMIMC